MTRYGALDLGSGTIKLSIFESGGGMPEPVLAEEENTELRRGMGEDGLLQAGPVEDTLRAVEAFVARAKSLGLDRVPAYGTSALRKARNRDLLFKPMELRHGILPVLLSEEEEGRLNLLGALSRKGAPLSMVVVDPGGDSTDCAWGPDWRVAQTASLPFGSVSLLERFGGGAEKTEPISQATLSALSAGVKQDLDAFAPAASLKRSKLVPAIRMNDPIARALATFAGRTKDRYLVDDLRALTFGMAAMDHESRVALIAGEPVGKVDRTPYGFMSWIALLEWMDAGEFLVEPWGIKLGAAMFLNRMAY